MPKRLNEAAYDQDRNTYAESQGEERQEKIASQPTHKSHYDKQNKGE